MEDRIFFCPSRNLITTSASSEQKPYKDKGMQIQKLYLILTLVGFAISSCSKEDNNDSKEITMWINARKVDCVGVGPQKCYEVQYSGSIESDNWEYFYDAIEGFDQDYEEGFIYKLKVERKTKEEVLEDEGKYAYKLLKIITKTSYN